VSEFAGRNDDKTHRRATNGDTLARLIRLALKELRETLRDRRTIITLVVMPLLVYPLISLVFQRFLLSGLRPGPVVYEIAVENESVAQLVHQYLSFGDVLLSRSGNGETGTANRTEAKPVIVAKKRQLSIPSPEDADLPQVRFFPVDDVEAAVANLDVKLHGKPEDFELPGAVSKTLDCEIMFVASSFHSRAARDYLERRLRAVNDECLKQRQRQLGIRERLTPVDAVHRLIEPIAETATVSLSALVPLILILMTMTGAVYPAIDLTAGERERGTLEMLIAAPVPRLGLLLAKYVAVLLVAIMTAVVNLFAMTITVASLGIGDLLFGESGLTVSVMLAVFALTILFAVFFSAVLLAITSFARSFKEAQAYLVPLMMVSIAPGMVSMFPGIKLNGPLAVAPLVNIVLLARDLVDHQADPLLALLVVVSTVVYAMAALAVAAKIFGADAILYGSDGSWSDLFRRPELPVPTPSLTSALMCLAMLLPLQFVVVNLLARAPLERMETKLIVQSLLSGLLFAGIPLLAAGWRKVSLRSGFRIKGANPIVFVASLLMGMSLWPCVYELVLRTEKLGLVTFSEEQLSWVNSYLEELGSISPLWALFAIAIVPAVTEELLFRGYLFSALSSRLSPWKAILLSAVLFGFFHLIVVDSLAIERLVPSTLLGVVLGWICYRTGSLFPGMVFHAANNGCPLMVSHYRKYFAQFDLDVEGKEHLPATWLMSAGLVVAVGFVLLVVCSRREKSATEIDV